MTSEGLRVFAGRKCCDMELVRDQCCGISGQVFAQEGCGLKFRKVSI